MTNAECAWSAAQWFIFSENVFSPLIYYSHLGTFVVSMIIGSVVFLAAPSRLPNRLLLAITGFFSIWVLFDLVLWASEKPEFIMFFWSAIVPVELLIYFSTLYLVAVFANDQRDVSLTEKVVALSFFIPVILFLPTKATLLGFDMTNCDREAIEGPLIQYMYVVELLVIAWIVHVVQRGYKLLTTDNSKKQLLYVAAASVVFLTLFSVGNILVTYFLELDWHYEQYKLFGMPIFAAIIAYSITKFHSFNAKVIAAEVLIVSLAIAVVSLVAIDDLSLIKNVASITFVLVCVLGFVLVRGVRREIQQREEIQRLAEGLREANTKLKELDVLKSQFLSIATHELRTPITIVRNFVSLMLDGTYGKVPPAAEVAARQVFERATDMAHSVDSYLNVSRIEQGKMQYTFATVDITRLTKLAVDGMKANADKKSLALTLTIKPGAEEMKASADGPKISEVLVNLIDNSIKYTPKGSVAVTVEKIGNVGRVTLKDTGVGMTPKTLQGLFKLFSPGEDAKKVNVSSTGIGMYISKTHVEAHKGTLNGYSEGEGKGSQFVLDLPLLP